MTGYQPNRDQYFLIRSFPGLLLLWPDQGELWASHDFHILIKQHRKLINTTAGVRALGMRQAKNMTFAGVSYTLPHSN